MLQWAQLETNPYFSGNGAPITEELTVDRMEVVGEIPPALSGAFLRNGSNAQFEPRGPYHLFDGDGMIHAVYLNDGEAAYRNRWILSRGLQYERGTGRAESGGMRDVFPPSPEAIKVVGRAKNVANINVVRHGGKLLALWEAGKPTEITRDLETVGEYDFGGALKGAFTAHPHFDAQTGEMFGFAYRPVPPFLTYYVVNRHGAITVQEVVPVERPVMMHDFCVSKDYAVFLYLPAVWDVQRAIRTGGPAMTWQPERGARIGVLPRRGKGSQVRWFDMPVGWCFHMANAFQRGSKLVVDCVRTDRVDPDVASADGSSLGSKLTRYTVDLERGGVASEQTFMPERCVEFPRVAAHMETREHRYAYMLAADPGVERVKFNSFNTVCRYDYQTGESSVYRVAEHGDATEFSYAPNPDSEREEDGYLMGYVYLADSHRSEFVILAASDLSAGPLARVKLPQRVPEGFHGNWMPGGL